MNKSINAFHSNGRPKRFCSKVCMFKDKMIFSSEKEFEIFNFKTNHQTMTIKEIAKYFNVNKNTLCDIFRRQKTIINSII